MTPEAFAASFGTIPPRVSRPPRKPAPVLQIVPAVVAPVLEPVKAWAPLPGFGPFIKPDPERKPDELAKLAQIFPDAIEDPVKLARFARARRLSGDKLAAAVPAWAKYKPIPRFVPDLSQRIPRGPVTVLTNDAHRAWLFNTKGKAGFHPRAGMSTAEYVAAWNLANSFKP